MAPVRPHQAPGGGDLTAARFNRQIGYIYIYQRSVLQRHASVTFELRGALAQALQFRAHALAQVGSSEDD